jgi:hypothetical protein
MKKIRNVGILLVGGLLLMRTHASLPGWAYAEGWFINSQRDITDLSQIDKTTDGNAVPNLDSRSASIWSGGNLDTAASAPGATFVGPTGSITASLVQSAFGQIVAGPLGYGGASSNLVLTAANGINSGAAYRYNLVLGQPIGMSNAAFNIIFPGVPTTFGTNAIVAPSTIIRHEKTSFSRGH